MEQCILTLGTVTRAIRARKLLAAAGIAARLIKQTEGAQGCAYGLELAAADMTGAMRLLEEAGVEFIWSRGKVKGRG